MKLLHPVDTLSPSRGMKEEKLAGRTAGILNCADGCSGVGFRLLHPACLMVLLAELNERLMWDQDALADSSCSQFFVRDQIIKCTNADGQHFGCLSFAIHEFGLRERQSGCRKTRWRGLIALHFNLTPRKIWISV